MNDKTLTVIIGQAAAQTMKGGKIDMTALLNHLAGTYQIDRGEVTKNDPIPEESTADRERNA